MKDNIFSRIKKSTQSIKQEIDVNPKLYGFSLISLILEYGDNDFNDFDLYQRDVIIMRIIDNLERRLGRSLVC